jgi:DUF971 family protein
MWPLQITISPDRQNLSIDFEDGTTKSFTATYLRVESPSAEVQGHGEGKKIITGKDNVKIQVIEPVGHYAIRILFDDGHQTGIYSWDYFLSMG